MLLIYLCLAGTFHFVLYQLCSFLNEGIPCILQDTEDTAYFFHSGGCERIALSEGALALGSVLRAKGCPLYVRLLVKTPSIHQTFNGGDGSEEFVYFTVHVLGDSGMPKADSRVFYVSSWSWQEIYSMGYAFLIHGQLFCT